jgi:hypothetical protein
MTQFGAVLYHKATDIDIHKFPLIFQPRSSSGHGAHHSASLMEHDKLHEERCHSRQPLSPASYTSSVGVYICSLSYVLGLICGALYRALTRNTRYSNIWLSSV